MLCVRVRTRESGGEGGIGYKVSDEINRVLFLNPVKYVKNLLISPECERFSRRGRSAHTPFKFVNNKIPV